jgi:hypothetical protein
MTKSFGSSVRFIGIRASFVIRHLVFVIYSVFQKRRDRRWLELFAAVKEFELN